MPPVELTDSLSENARKFVPLITFRGKLRASCPDKDLLEGQVAYVWRMVAFYLSTKPAHGCMPVMAEFWVNREEIPKLDQIVSEIVDSVPKENWRGVQKWTKII